MSRAIKDVTVAVNGFEQLGLEAPIEAVRAAGARAVVVSAEKDPIQACGMTRRVTPPMLT